MIITPINLILLKQVESLSDGLFKIKNNNYLLYSVIPKENINDFVNYSFDKFYKRIIPLINILAKNTNVNIELKHEKEDIFVNGLFAEYIYKKFERGYSD